MGILETAWDATNREQDEKLLIGGIADFSLRSEIREYLPQLSGDDFWNPAYGHIWDAAKLLADQDRIITLAPFREHLTDGEYRTLQAAQGMGVRLIEVTKGIEFVREASKRRKLLQGMKDVASVAIRSESYEDVLGAAHDVVDNADHAVLSDDVVEVADLADQFWWEVENPVESKTIPTPWHKLNELLPGGGLGYGGFMVSAAYTSGGKSLFMTNCAAHAALQGFKVAFFSIEMPRMEVFDRILACTAEASVSAISNRKVSNDPSDPEYWQSADFNKLDTASELLKSTTFRVWDESEMSLDWIRQQCVAMKRSVGLDLVVIDYLQILDSDYGNANREQSLSKDAQKMKAIAKALDVHVLSASQMNDNEVGQVPTFRSLRESKGIANNANQIVFIHHETDPATGFKTGMADLVIAKNRGGRSGSIPIEFMGNQARFREFK